MPLCATPPEDGGQDQPVKRGPGRPRKQRPASPEPAPADTGPRVTDRFGASRMVGKSHSTIKRLEQNDPDWPKPFALGGGHACNYLISDIEAFLLKRSADAQTATPRGLENLRPGNKARRPEKKRAEAAIETA